MHLVGFLFIVVIADARNHEPEKLYTAVVISLYTTLNGSITVQLHVMSEHNCHNCSSFTELH
jgi:hypothetical protein